MFSGKKDLFKGLYAEAWMNRPDYQSHPVIRLSMNAVTTDSGIEALKKSICLQVKKSADRLNIQLVNSEFPSDLFDELIVKATTKYNQKVIILIDEYDKPGLDFYDKPDIADLVRETLANFYVRIKANDEYIRFVFMTGVSKFAKMGVFSKLKNLTDISLNKKYAAMCGITHDELLANFPDYLEETAEEMEITTEQLVNKMETQYDGFSFDGNIKLYNPYSTLLFFTDKMFKNYWFDSGTTTMMDKYIKANSFTVEQFRNLQVSLNFVQNPGEIDATPPEGFLYQNGFLTLREGISNDFSLDYPNGEVLDTMSRLVTNALLQKKDDNFMNISDFALVALANKDVDLFVDTLNRLLASVPYDDYVGAGKQIQFYDRVFKNILNNKYKLSVQEWLYRSTILAFLRGCGVVVVGEMHTNLGRADLVVSHKRNTYIIELKVAKKDKSPAAKAAEAYNQIFEQNYHKPYPAAICIGLAIDDEKREITEYKTNVEPE